MFNYEMRRIVILRKTETCKSKSFLVIKVPIQAVLVSFINHNNLSVIGIGITKCEKNCVHRLGGGPWPPVAPLDPPLAMNRSIVL